MEYLKVVEKTDYRNRQDGWALTDTVLCERAWLKEYTPPDGTYMWSEMGKTRGDLVGKGYWLTGCRGLWGTRNGVYLDLGSSYTGIYKVSWSCILRSVLCKLCLNKKVKKKKNFYKYLLGTYYAWVTWINNEQIRNGPSWHVNFTPIRKTEINQMTEIMMWADWYEGKDLGSVSVEQRNWLGLAEWHFQQRKESVLQAEGNKCQEPGAKEMRVCVRLDKAGVTQPHRNPWATWVFSL